MESRNVNLLVQQPTATKLTFKDPGDRYKLKNEIRDKLLQKQKVDTHKDSRVEPLTNEDVRIDEITDRIAENIKIMRYDSVLGFRFITLKDIDTPINETEDSNLTIIPNCNLFMEAKGKMTPTQFKDSDVIYLVLLALDTEVLIYVGQTSFHIKGRFYKWQSNSGVNGLAHAQAATNFLVCNAKQPLFDMALAYADEALIMMIHSGECEEIRSLWKEEEELWRLSRRNSFLNFSLSGFKKDKFRFISLQIHEMYYQELFQSTKKGLNHRENFKDEKIERLYLTWFNDPRPSGNVEQLKKYVKQIADKVVQRMQFNENKTNRCN